MEIKITVENYSDSIAREALLAELETKVSKKLLKDNRKLDYYIQVKTNCILIQMYGCEETQEIIGAYIKTLVSNYLE